MAISSSTILQDVEKFLVTLIRTNVTDPISTRRSSNSKFVLSSYPSRDTQYPFISVVTQSPDTVDKSIGTQVQRVTITSEIRVWARNVRERDEICDAIFNILRTKQTSSGGSVDENLFDMTFLNIGDINEDKVRSRLIEVTYNYFAG